MQDRHIDRQQYFNEQVYTVEKHVIPFLSEVISLDSNISVLEIGCGEGGNLKPFLDIGCNVVGIDLSEGKIANARLFFNNHENKEKIKFYHRNIYEVDDIGQFDLIITRDVLEHIHNQGKFMEMVKKFLKPGGKFFLGFPPWQNPFGGHQQMCESKILSKMPYFHILPAPIYKLILKLFGEEDIKIKGFLEIKATRINIERFEKILKRKNYRIDKKTFYFINPNYEIKFRLKPRKQTKLISAIPYLRNFFTTTCYYIVSTKNSSPNGQ